PAVEVIRSGLKCGNVEEYRKFANEWTEKVREAQQELAGNPILAEWERWSGPDCTRRHVFTRYLVHGHHQHMCLEMGFHLPAQKCQCRFCGQQCPKDHALACSASPGLTALAAM